jgi:hypothetical protein
MEKITYARTTSYQRRLSNIAFWRQRGEELEHIIRAVDDKLRERGISIRIFRRGISGEQFLTDLNAGDINPLRLTNIDVF